MATTARKKAAPKQLTTAQRLDSIIKSARKIMRKDKGLNGDLDRLPMLTWIMFLKFLDDMERIEEGRAELAGKDSPASTSTFQRCCRISLSGIHARPSSSTCAVERARVRQTAYA